MLSDEQIDNFREIYKETFGEEISREKALKEGARLIQLIQAVYKPIRKQELQNP